MIFINNKDNQTVWNKHRTFFMFSTQWRSSVFLITFQNYSDSRPWLWTSDFDCYELNGACQLSLIDYYQLNLHYDFWHDIIIFFHLLRIDMMSISAFPTGMCKLFHVISEYNWLRLLTTIYFCCIIPCLVIIVKAIPKIAPSHQFTLGSYLSFE